MRLDTSRLPVMDTTGLIRARDSLLVPVRRFLFMDAYHHTDSDCSDAMQPLLNVRHAVGWLNELIAIETGYNGACALAGMYKAHASPSPRISTFLPTLIQILVIYPPPHILPFHCRLRRPTLLSFQQLTSDAQPASHGLPHPPLPAARRAVRGSIHAGPRSLRRRPRSRSPPSQPLDVSGPPGSNPDACRSFLVEERIDPRHPSSHFEGEQEHERRRLDLRLRVHLA